MIGAKVEGTHTRDYTFRTGSLAYGWSHAPLAEKDIDNDYLNRTDVYHANLFHNADWSDRLSSALNLDFVYNRNRYRQATAETIRANGWKQKAVGRGIGRLPRVSWRSITALPPVCR